MVKVISDFEYQVFLRHFYINFNRNFFSFIFNKMCQYLIINRVENL